MRIRRRFLPFAALIAGLALTTVAAAGATWGHAIEVPGSAGLNLGGNAQLTTISCAKAGNCSAGGSYTDGSGHGESFVVNEKNGVWGSAIEVPGTADLNVGGNAQVTAISCAKAGYCAAGGYYTGANYSYPFLDQQAFVVVERNGVWGTAVEVPGTADLNAGGEAHVLSIACATTGSCSAGGYFADGQSDYPAFVVNDKNGVWSKAVEVHTLNFGTNAEVLSMSCPKAGFCSAGGYWGDVHQYQQGHQVFVVDEKKGVWSRTTQVPVYATLNKGDWAQVSSISCAKPGFCTAGGYYSSDHAGYDLQAFVVSEEKGVWGKAVELPGSAALNVGGPEFPLAYLNGVSCTKAGFCSAGGAYTDDQGRLQPLVATETNGTWSKAIKVPGFGAIDLGGGEVTSISCSAPGFCTAGGTTKDDSGDSQAFLVSEKKGVWAKAVDVPGLGVLNAGTKAELSTISCARGSHTCAAGGFYTDGSTFSQAFVTTP